MRPGAGEHRACGRAYLLIAVLPVREVTISEVKCAESCAGYVVVRHKMLVISPLPRWIEPEVNRIVVAHIHVRQPHRVIYAVEAKGLPNLARREGRVADNGAMIATPDVLSVTLPRQPCEHTGWWSQAGSGGTPRWVDRGTGRSAGA
jgi:hypothetical protein